MPTLDPNPPTPKPTRKPTLDPNQPTDEPVRPTRIPTLDPDQPTPKPTRVPTLDPDQPTDVPNQAQVKPTTSPQSVGDASTVFDSAADTTDTADTANSGEATDADWESSGKATCVAGEDYPYDFPEEHVTEGMSARKMYKEYCEECHSQQWIRTQDAPELEALNAIMIAEVVRDGPEDMAVFTYEDIPDRALNILIDYVLLCHSDSEP